MHRVLQESAASNEWMRHAIRSDFVRPYFWRLLRHVALAGGWYLVATFATWGLLGTIASLQSGDILGTLVALAFSSLVAFVCGYCYAGLVGCLSVPFGWYAAKALGRRPRPDRFGMFSGSFTAFLCMLPVQLSLLQFPYAVVAVLGWLVFPGMAIVFGQVAGALAAPNTLRARRLDPAQGRFELGLPRFRVGQLLGLMVVFSVTLTLLKLTGMLFTPVLIAAGLWAAFQTVSASPAAWVANQLLTRLRRRRIRKSRGRRFRMKLREHRTRSRST